MLKSAFPAGQPFQPRKSTKSYPSNKMSKRWKDTDNGDGQFFKLIEIPFSPFQNEFGDSDDESIDYPAARRNYSSSSSSSRQEYLRSFTFSREQTLQERVKSRLRRFKAAVCAVMACNYYDSLPRRIRRIKRKLVLKSLRSPRTRGVRSSLLQGSCFQGNQQRFNS